MVAKKSGPVPCTLCDSGFASIPNLQQVGRFPTFSGNFTDFSPQHLRDKHGIIVKTQAPPAQTQPPAQEPPVQAKSEPQVQAKNEPQAQAKSEPQVQTKSEPQVQAKSEPPETVRTPLFHGRRPSAKAGISPPFPPRIRQHANIASPISPLRTVSDRFGRNLPFLSFSANLRTA